MKYTRLALYSLPGQPGAQQTFVSSPFSHATHNSSCLPAEASPKFSVMGQPVTIFSL